MVLPDPIAPFLPPESGGTPLFTGQEYRPQQKELASRILEILEREGVLVCEAGTGTGKTLAYLIPLIYYGLSQGEKVLISTETRSLQNQILEGEMPAVQKYLGRKINVELCFGAGNYLCPRRLAEVMAEGRIDPGMEDSLEDFLEWSDETSSGLFLEYTGYMNPRFKYETARDSDDCGGSRCARFDDCYYFHARDRWKSADVLIANHSLLSAHFMLDGKLLPEFSAAVIDEAHAFPGVFSSACASQSGYLELLALLRKLPEKTADLNIRLNEFHGSVVNTFPIFAGRQKRIVDPLDIQGMGEFLDEIQKTHSILAEKLEDLRKREEDSEESDETRRLSQRIQTLERHISVFRMFEEGPGEDRIHWIESDNDSSRTNYIFHVAPVYAGNLLKKKVIDHLNSVLFTSATITTGKRDQFEHFLNQLGLLSAVNEEDESSKVETIVLDSPFDYKRRALLFIPSRMPDPSTEEQMFHSTVARGIKYLESITGGGAFVLFTSIRSLNAVHEEMKEIAPEMAERIQSQVELGPRNALSKFRESENGILFGLSTFWQGIDIVGDSLRLVVIVRIPFRVPDDPVIQGLSEYEENKGRNPFWTVQLPGAIISIKQGFGRLIRSSKDRGMVAILDPRVRTKSYGKLILDSLPPAKMITEGRAVKKEWDKLFGR